MKLHPRVTRSVVELVKRFEGLRRRAARLADGGWTIGYGHTRSAREGAVVSPEDAEALLYYDLSEVAEKVEAWTFTPLNQNQFEALTAFAFNIGIENFRNSTVLKRVNEGHHLMAAAALELWRKADFGGEDLVVDALVRRRAAEKAHFLTPPEGFRPSPTPVLRPTFDHSVIDAAAISRANSAVAVVDASLEGDIATATVERHGDAVKPAEDVAASGSEAVRSEREGVMPGVVADLRQAALPLTAVAATGLATAKLHQLFPDKTPEAAQVAAPSVSVFSHLGSTPPAEGPPEAVNDGPFGSSMLTNTGPTNTGPTNTGPTNTGPRPLAELAPSPTTDFGGFAPPPVRQFDAPPPPFGEAAAVSETPAPPASITVSQPADALSPSSPTLFAKDFNRATVNPKPTLNERIGSVLKDRTVIYFAIGLLGVAFFAAALFSMFTGKANAGNLVIGLLGIVLMTPAGGYFLLRFLNLRDGADKI